jgi:hypothetical protein
MKFRFVKYLSVVILAAFALAGCESNIDDTINEGEEITIRLNVFPETISVDYKAQTSLIAVTTNASEWDFVSTVSWVDATREGEDINLIFSQNNSTNTLIPSAQSKQQTPVNTVQPQNNDKINKNLVDIKDSIDDMIALLTSVKNNTENYRGY